MSSIEFGGVEFGGIVVAVLLSVCPAGAFGRQDGADVLVPVPLGSVKLEGVIGESADRCIRARIYSDWAKGPMYDECVNSFRTHWDDTDGHVGWQNEYWGKTMLCVAGAIAYTGDRGLAQWAEASADAFVREFQWPNGYLSTYSREDFIGFWPYNVRSGVFNIWGRKYTMWALIELYRRTGDATCLAAARKMADHLIVQLRRTGHPIEDTGYWYGISSMSILRPVNELYRETGDSRYLDFAKTIVAAMSREESKQGAVIYNAFRKEPIFTWFENPTHWAKVYEFLSCLEGLVDYYRLTGEKRALEAAMAWYAHLVDEELNPMRSVGYMDHFVNGAMRHNGMTELCDVTHWIRFLRELLLVTGRAEYADRLEEAFLNAFLAGVWRNGRWGAHVVRSHGSRHVSAPPQTGMTEHQCCPDNMMRTYFDIALSTAFTAPDGAEVLALFTDSLTRFGETELRVTGGYPYADVFRVCRVSPKAGRLRLRVPSWSKWIRVDGSERTFSDGWCELEMPAGAKTVSVAFDMKPRTIDSRLEWREDLRADSSDIGQYTVRNMEWMTPEMQGMVRKDPGMQVMRGPLVLAKGRLAGTSRSETLGASTLRAQGWTVEAHPLEPVAANVAVPQAWMLEFRKGGDRRYVPVADFAHVSNVDDPENWFSLWF